ncbi:MAG: hypothetical protein KKA16_01605 [Alphaproteobacteria bacterium]|nr:hypothetical protein [Alphaproteobacteria bacterium]MBU2379733.1 hypothetical protein [Alphaproteobacteria bacterium]
MKAVSITLILGLALSGPARAQEQDSAAAMRPDDADLTCVQLADEAAQLSQAMSDDAEGGGLVSTVTDVARTGASMLVPGAGLVMAGADAVTRPGREREEAAELTVENRWHYLNGLAAGRGCGGEEVAEVGPPVVEPTEPAPVLNVPVGRLPDAPSSLTTTASAD